MLSCFFFHGTNIEARTKEGKLMHQHSCTYMCSLTTANNYLSADSAARDDASAALVDQPDADLDASAAEADALMAVDTFCLQQYKSRQCANVTVHNFFLAKKLKFIYTESSSRTLDYESQQADKL